MGGSPGWERVPAPNRGYRHAANGPSLRQSSRMDEKLTNSNFKGRPGMSKYFEIPRDLLPLIEKREKPDRRTQERRKARTAARNAERRASGERRRQSRRKGRRG
jgi:hypothetical protein